MCRFDIILEENMEVAFRPLPCNSRLWLPDRTRFFFYGNSSNSAEPRCPLGSAGSPGPRGAPQEEPQPPHWTIKTTRLVLWIKSWLLENLHMVTYDWSHHVCLCWWRDFWRADTSGNLWSGNTATRFVTRLRKKLLQDRCHGELSSLDVQSLFISGCI